MKTKIKSHGDKVSNFYDKSIPRLECNNTCLAVITLASAFSEDDSYYPQVFLKECNYIEKKIIIIRHINENLSIFSDDSSEE